MAKFLTVLRLEKLEEAESAGRGLWLVLAPLIYESDVLGKIEVPAGTTTDLASVPRIPLAYWLTGGAAEASAVVHDYLCETQVYTRQLSWSKAAKVFLEAMKVEHVPAWRRYAMYIAVLLAGPIMSPAGQNDVED